MGTRWPVCRMPSRRLLPLGCLLLGAACARAGGLPPAAKHHDPSARPALGARDLVGRLERRIAELRAANGLPPLQADPGLERHAARAGDARAHSALVLDTGLALRILAQGGDELALWRSLAGAAPGRAELLNPDVTHLGIAVRSIEDGLEAVVVLAQLAVAADVEVAAARLLQAINRNRGARGAPALQPDPTLTEVARRAANEFFQPPQRDEREVVERANAELERYGLRYRRVAALAVLVSDPLEAAALEPALDADARAVGIAAATGFRPDSGVRRLAVVVALGWEREDAPAHTSERKSAQQRAQVHEATSERSEPRGE